MTLGTPVKGSSTPVGAVYTGKNPGMFRIKCQKVIDPHLSIVDWITTTFHLNVGHVVSHDDHVTVSGRLSRWQPVCPVNVSMATDKTGTKSKLMIEN